jgi:hypothetical protein
LLMETKCGAIEVKVIEYRAHGLAWNGVPVGLRSIRDRLGQVRVRIIITRFG